MPVVQGVFVIQTLMLCEGVTPQRRLEHPSHDLCYTLTVIDRAELLLGLGATAKPPSPSISLLLEAWSEDAEHVRYWKYAYSEESNKACAQGVPILWHIGVVNKRKASVIRCQYVFFEAT